jgi:hypothetical protein
MPSPEWYHTLDTGATCAKCVRSSGHSAKFGVVMAVRTTPCGLAGRYHRSGETHCLHPQSSR